MKNKVLKVIRFTSLLPVILLVLSSCGVVTTIPTSSDAQNSATGGSFFDRGFS